MGRDYLAWRSEIEAHENRKDNPHGVTKSQVGLGNVPNVATNDQTPTYTAAIANANLASGEKMSTAFGKIAKAISSLISHLANTSNPHSVTKTQVGLGSVDNTADSAKPVSTAQATAIADAKAAGTTAQTNIASHTSNTSNPHGVTKSQVGLGNVPNVATNDQTPTYTAASSLTALTSGEKLSVAFGKIAKAVSDLISHIANKSNPHGVTAAQVGAAASSHNHGAGDIASGTMSSDRLPTIPITKGGTGATDAATARSNLGITPSNIGAAASSHTHTGTVYDLPLSTNYTGIEYYKPYYVKISNVVYVWGWIRKTSGLGNNTTFATLPSGYRPSGGQHIRTACNTWENGDTSNNNMHSGTLEIKRTGEMFVNLCKINGVYPDTDVVFCVSFPAV